MMCMGSDLDKVCTENMLPTTTQTMSGILRIEFSLTEDSVLSSLPQKSKTMAVSLISPLPDPVSGWKMGPVKVFENGNSTELTANTNMDMQNIHTHPV